MIYQMTTWYHTFGVLEHKIHDLKIHKSIGMKIYLHLR